MIVSAEEGDAAEAINKVKMNNLDKLEEWFGVSRGREMEVNVPQINLVLFDRKSVKVDSSNNVDLLEGGLTNSLIQRFSSPKPQIDEDVKRYIYSQIKKLYPNSYTKVVDINSGSGGTDDRASIDWKKFSYRKVHLKNF